ncbi:PqqD family protein [Microbacteriaceae bacterium VKM Ac-2854]|nr:PqqD family protein [Microbacteriaceae bacterium VKM Ac-2854]
MKSTDDERSVYVLVLNQATTAPHVLEGPAAATWNCVDGVRTTADIVRELAVAHDVAEETIAADVSAFLEELTSWGILSTAD